MSERLQVARVDDPVSHTYAKAAYALGAGAALGVGVIIAALTGGSAFVVATSALSTGGGLLSAGTWLAGLVAQEVGGSETGTITSGAVKTWTEDKLNARITDPVKCEDPAGTQALLLLVPLFAAVDAISSALEGAAPGQHPDAKLKFGSKTVFVEDRNASRLSEGVDCDSKISGAAQRSWFGGTTVELEGAPTRSEIPAAMEWTVWTLDWIGTVAGLAGIKGLKDLTWKAMVSGDQKVNTVLKAVEVGTKTTGAGVKAARQYENDKGLKKAERVLNVIELLATKKLGDPTKVGIVVVKTTETAGTLSKTPTSSGGYETVRY